MKLSVYMTLYTLTHVALLIYEAEVRPPKGSGFAPSSPGPKAFSGLFHLSASLLPGSLSPTLWFSAFPSVSLSAFPSFYVALFLLLLSLAVCHISCSVS